MSLIEDITFPDFPEIIFRNIHSSLNRDIIKNSDEFSRGYFLNKNLAELFETLSKIELLRTEVRDYLIKKTDYFKKETERYFQLKKEKR